MNNSYMSKVRLIAWSHFTAILKAKAFWLGVLMTPAIGVAMIAIVRFAESSQPTRYVVVVDKTGDYQQAVGDAIGKGYVQRALKDYASHFAKYRISARDSTAEPLAARRSKDIVERYLKGPAASAEAEVKTYDEMAALVDDTRALLRADAPAYILPKRRFVLVATPEELQVDHGAELGNVMRSYLLGAKKVPLNSTEQSIDAIAIIDTDAIIDTGAISDTGSASDANSFASVAVPRIQYWSTNLNNNALSNLIQNAVDQRLRQQLLLARGIEMDELVRIENVKADVLQFDAKKQKGDEGRTLADRISIAVPIFFTIAMFMILLTSTTILLQSIVEEKSNRLIEVLLSSVTPTQLMAGKLLGVSAVSIVSLAVWVSLAIAGAYFGFGMSDAAASGADAMAAANISSEQIQAVMSAIDKALGLLPIFLFCFICGYLIYASLFLAIGSLCASARDANTLITPLMILMMVPLFLTRFFITDPHGTVATVFTWIPLYTPFAIVVRMSADPPLSEMVGSAFIMIAMTAVALWMSARIFRYGVLYSGETPKLLQVLRLAFVKQQM